MIIDFYSNFQVLFGRFVWLSGREVFVFAKKIEMSFQLCDKLVQWRLRLDFHLEEFMFGEKKDDNLRVVSQPNPSHRNETTIIESDASFEGKLTFEGDVAINGAFKGEVFSSGELTVGITGKIDGDISIGTVHVRGEVRGTIKAERKIIIHANAAVYGDVSTPSLVVEDGAVFEGGCKMENRLSKTSNLSPHLNTLAKPPQKQSGDKNEDDSPEFRI